MNNNLLTSERYWGNFLNASGQPSPMFLRLFLAIIDFARATGTSDVPAFADNQAHTLLSPAQAFKFFSATGDFKLDIKPEQLQQYHVTLYESYQLAYKKPAYVSRKALQRWFLQHAFADPDKYHKSLNEFLLQKGVYLIDPFTEGPFKFKEIPRSSFPEKPNESTRIHLDQCFTTFKAKLNQLPIVSATQSQAPVVPKPQTAPAATASPQQKTDFAKQLSDMQSKTWKSIDEATRRMQAQLAQEEAQQKAQFNAQVQQNQLRQAQLRRQQQQAAIDQQLEYTRQQWANINGETYYDGDGKRRYRPGYLDYVGSCIF
jgi:hypothetical protein